MPNQKNSIIPGFEGEVFTGHATRLVYATDASVYREKPLMVAYPKNEADIRRLVHFARENNTFLIPRAAGTSLAGQCVGSGIVVDVSKHMTRIVELNAEEKWVIVEPGVILDDLNRYLAQHGLFFGPETSTSNRCMIGGMVGNNACGAHSILYGSTRGHVLEINTILSDGSACVFKPLEKNEFEEKCNINNLEGAVYRNIKDILSKSPNRENIVKEFPDPKIKRRNTGYAIDLLLDSAPFVDRGKPFNFCKILAGSEGTLAFSTKIKLNLVPFPPKHTLLLCVHFEDVIQALRANIEALKLWPSSVELIDRVIVECTRKSFGQQKNGFFIKGSPAAILLIEFMGDDPQKIEQKAEALTKTLEEKKMGYHYPVVKGDDIKKVWELRKAGLGLLSNVPGDRKPVAVVEDTAVDPLQLPEYVAEFQKILEKHHLDCVYYAHVATGEIHFRPVLDLKKFRDTGRFRQVAYEVAQLVKKYKGSLSGEHGDGRLRGEFLRMMIGDENYRLLQSIKKTWDPANIFNRGKILDTPPMDTSLRYFPGQKAKEIETVFDFSDKQGILRAVENCNGSADCRKPFAAGGTMCPSYMATLDEKDTTRARANLLREFLTNSPKENPFGHKELFDILELCLSCKGCKSECPSGIDMSKLKAEFLHQYHKANRVPAKWMAVANINIINRLLHRFSILINPLIKWKATGGVLKTLLGFSRKRQLPKLSSRSLKRWAASNLKKLNPAQPKATVCFFADEFTNIYDVRSGKNAIKTLTALGYKVIIPRHRESGRAAISMGMLKKARRIARANVRKLAGIVNDSTPLVGIEPSALLSFRDEYIDLCGNGLKEDAKTLAENTLLFDEFICREIDNGNINADAFKPLESLVKLHGHCHQKSLASIDTTIKMLEFAGNRVEQIPSGCCGMAGSFGYAKKNYDLSMKIGEMVLFPEIRKNKNGTIVAAPGTSCRQQIMDGTGVEAWHPVDILYNCLKNK